jgi:hypothetical protein
VSTLDELAGSARENAPRWDGERAARVLASTLAVREKRVQRAKAMRRTFAAASAAAVLGVILLRVGSAPASTMADVVEPAPASSAELLSARDGDGGYLRD